MKHQRFGFFAAALCLALATGCVQNHGTYSVLTNRAIDVADIDLAEGPRKRGIEGRAVSHTVLLFFPVGPGASPSRALNDALAQGQGDLMTDATLKSWRWTIIVYSQSGWSLRGDVMNTTPR